MGMSQDPSWPPLPREEFSVASGGWAGTLVSVSLPRQCPRLRREEGCFPSRTQLSTSSRKIFRTQPKKVTLFLLPGVRALVEERPAHSPKTQVTQASFGSQDPGRSPAPGGRDLRDPPSAATWVFRPPDQYFHPRIPLFLTSSMIYFFWLFYNLI